MSVGLKNLKSDLHEKMVQLQARIEVARARLKDGSAETRSAVREQLAKLRTVREMQVLRISTARERLRDNLEARDAEKERDLEQWRAARELKQLTKRAGRAEEYAADAILLAAAALDEADAATLEAIEARMLADEAIGED